MTWDLPRSLEVGRYALRIEGFIGREKRPYQLISEPFLLSGEEGLLIREATREGAEVAVKLTYANAPTNDNGSNAFTSLKPTGSYLHVRGVGDKLSEPSGSLKPYRFILGSTISSTLEVDVWTDSVEAMSQLPANFKAQLDSNSDRCDVTLVKNRSLNEEGEDPREERVMLSNVPCSRYEFMLPPELSNLEIYIRFTDPFGNRSELRALR